MKNREKRKLFSPVTDRPHCLYCGKRLREETHLDKEAEDRFYRGRAHAQERDEEWEKRRLGIPTGTFGYGGNGYFCTLTCGYRWAVRQCNAITGNRPK